MPTNPSILIIDDDVNLIRVFVAELLRCGYMVQIAMNAEAAIDALLASRYDAILLNNPLSHADSLLLLPALKTIAPTAPVVIVTAYDGESMHSHAVQAGAADILSKPFDLDHLTSTIERHLGTRKSFRNVNESQPLLEVPHPSSITVKPSGKSTFSPFQATVTGSDFDSVTIQFNNLETINIAESIRVEYRSAHSLFEFKTIVLRKDEESNQVVLSKPTSIQRVQRRRYERLDFHNPVILKSLENAATSQTKAMARNISLGGIELTLSTAITNGMRFRLTLQLPSDENTEISTSCEVVRSIPIGEAASHRLYRAALRFTRMNARSRQALASYLTSNMSA